MLPSLFTIFNDHFYLLLDDVALPFLPLLMTVFACCDYCNAFSGTHNGFYFYILILLDCVAWYNEYSLF